MRIRSINKKALSSSYLYSFLAKGFHIIFGFISTIIVNRFLGVELRGEYAYITNIISMIIVIGNLGIYQSYAYNKRQNIHDIQFLYMNLVIKQFIIYTLVAFAFNIILYFILSLNLYELITLIVVTFLTIFSILSQQISMIASVEFFKIKSKIFIFAEFIKIVLLVFMYIMLDKDLIPILIINTVYHIILIVFCFNKLHISIDLKHHNLKFAWSTIKQGFFPMLFTLLLSLNYRIDILFLRLSGYVTISDVGLYAVGVQLATYVWVFPDIFKEVLFSKTAKSDSIKEITYCIKFSLFVESIFLFFIVIFGESIFTLLYGSEYAGAVNVTRIIFIGVLSMTLFKLLTPLYNAKGKFIENFLILFSSVFINIILNFILIPPLGNIGAAIASVIGYTVCGFVYLFRFKNEYKLKLKDIVLIDKDDIRYIGSVLFRE